MDISRAQTYYVFVGNMVINASGHEVKMPRGILAYHVERMLTALDLATGFRDAFAETLAVDHAVQAAHAARS